MAIRATKAPSAMSEIVSTAFTGDALSPVSGTAVSEDVEFASGDDSRADTPDISSGTTCSMVGASAWIGSIGAGAGAVLGIGVGIGGPNEMGSTKLTIAGCGTSSGYAWSPSCGVGIGVGVGVGDGVAGKTGRLGGSSDGEGVGAAAGAVGIGIHFA